MVGDAKSIHLANVLQEPMRESFQVTLKEGEAYHEENMKTGCVGTIMTFLECDSAGSRIQLGKGVTELLRVRRTARLLLA